MPIQKISAIRPYSRKTTVNKQQDFGQTQAAQPPKKSKTPLIIAGLIIAAGAIALYAKKGAKTLSQPIFQQSTKQIEENINFLKNKYKPEATRVLNENTYNGMVNLGNIENAAAIRSASPTEQSPFHQAASWIEEAYIKAYSKAQLSDGNNILNYIHRRIGTENDALAQMYAQMPKEEYTIRLNQFANEAAKSDKHVGMTPEKFISIMIEKIIPKAKETLASK